MLSCSMVLTESFFILQQNFGVFTSQPNRRSSRTCAHDHFQMILGCQCYGSIKPGKIILALFGFQLSPCKLSEMSKLKAQLMHLFEITFPFRFFPMFGIVINSGQYQVLVIEPRFHFICSP